MRKVCPRCGESFECCADGDVARCHCASVGLTEEQRVALRKHFADCLCNSCLRDLADGCSGG
ncbi:MAG: cysteine-rich CWC family protein [Alistipes sp.]|nr:cysteine-rich CWC family protein [Alistipes sp.]